MNKKDEEAQKKFENDKISLRELKMLRPDTKIILKAICEVKDYSNRTKK